MRRLSDGDHADWAAFTRQVRTLAGRAAPPAPQPVIPQPAAPPPAAPRAVSPPPRPRRLDLPPLVIGAPPAGLDDASWQRFRSGRTPPTRKLDLHGHTAERAFHALATAIARAVADRVRCLEVITGQGRGGQGSGARGGVIRRELPAWLNRPDLRPMVLAAVHPHPQNQGATRLLLRRPR